MHRREFVTIAGTAALAGLTGRSSAAAPTRTAPHGAMPGANGPAAAGAPEGPADFTVRIAPLALEIAPSHYVSTIGYNGTSPGPVLRMKEGKPVTVDVINDTDTAELVHWHGLFLPPEVDGAVPSSSAPSTSGGRNSPCQ